MSLTCWRVLKRFPDNARWVGAWRGWAWGWMAQTPEDWWAHSPRPASHHLRVVRRHPGKQSNSQVWRGCTEGLWQEWERHSHTSLPGSPQWRPLQTPGSPLDTCHCGSAWATSQHNGSDKQHDLDLLANLPEGGVETSTAPSFFTFSLSLSHFFSVQVSQATWRVQNCSSLFTLSVFSLCPLRSIEKGKKNIWKSSSQPSYRFFFGSAEPIPHFR